MVQSIKQLYGHHLGGTDGDIGTVKDFYFDDQRWVVRYVIVDTGSWLSGRQVLITPHAFATLEHTGKRLLVNLTKRQIEDCPLIETHKPVSRQIEAAVYRYYGLPIYWQGGGIWGMGSAPMSDPAAAQVQGDAAVEIDRTKAVDDPHLRSAQEVNGYRIQANDGEIGHISDFLMDGQSWAIRHLVIKTGGWFSGREVQIPVESVEQVKYAQEAVSVNLSREVIRTSPQYHLPLPVLVA